MAKPFSEMPTASCLISNALKLTSVDFHRKVYALAEKHGGIFKIKAPGRTVVVITDPTALAEATAMEFTGVDKPADIYNTFAILCSSSTPPTYPVLGIGSHITPQDSDGEKKWSTLRSGFAEAFSAMAVPQYVPTLVEEAGKVLSQVGSQSVDVMELLVGRISLSTTGRVMFGYDAFDCTDLSRPCDFWREIITARKGAVGIARSPLIKLQHKLCPFSHDVQEYKDDLNAVYKKYEEIYSEMEGRAAAAAGAAAVGSLPTIVQAFQSTPDYRYPDNRMSKDDTIAMIGNLVVAGTLPAGTAAAYTICLIACHPEVQAKLHAELDKAGLSSSSKGGGRPFEASDVAKLPYLANVIKEAMRVNSVVPQVNRAAAADIELGGYKIPKGTLMFLSMGGMHASPNNFTEPHRFYPERWEQQPAAADGAAAGGTPTWTGNSKDIAGSFTPFSSGTRSCLGMHWARLAISGTVATVLSRFKLTAPSDMAADSLAAGETFSVSIYPKTPLMLTFTPRTAAV